MGWIKKKPLIYVSGAGISVCRFFTGSLEIDNHTVYFVIVRGLLQQLIYGFGWKNKERNQKESMARETTTALPGGLEHHKYDKATLQVLCGARELCWKQEIADAMKPMKVERDKALREITTLRTKVLQMIDDIKKSGTQNPILLAHAEVDRELGI
jgi:hypothetical protein